MKLVYFVFFVSLFLPSNLCAQVDHWVFLGASITRGAVRDGKKLETLISDTFDTKVKVSNEAVSGMTSRGLLLKLPGIIKKYPQAKYFPIHIGGNDVSSQRPYPRGSKNLSRNIKQILKLLQDANKIPILFRLTFRNYKNLRQNKNYNLGSKPYVENIYDPLIQDTAPEVNGEKLIVDAYSFMFNNKSYLSRDGVHFTMKGYNLFLSDFLIPNLFSKFYATKTLIVSEDLESDGYLVSDGVDQLSDDFFSGLTVEDENSDVTDESLDLVSSEFLELNSIDDPIHKSYRLIETFEAILKEESFTLKSSSLIYDLQLIMRSLGFDSLKMDGIYGKQTKKQWHRFKTSHVQELLNLLGFDCGKVDGIYGSETKKSIHRFYDSIELSAEPIISLELIEYLNEVYSNSQSEKGFDLEIEN